MSAGSKLPLDPIFPADFPSVAMSFNRLVDVWEDEETLAGLEAR